jgi:hypothetical protein
MTKSPIDSTHPGRSSASGASDSSKTASKASRSSPGAVGPADFPPSVVLEIKVLACELPCQNGLPLSRFSMAELNRAAIRGGIVASIGETTIWRWLSEDAIRPWRPRSWIFPRDPAFSEKAGRVLDLYEGFWQGVPLSPEDCVISTDEKTSIQARRRLHATRPPAAGVPMRVEHEYERRGAWAYLAAWEVRRARIFGRCERKTGIAPFKRLVSQVMAQEPYRSAPRVFWIMDNGSSHRGQRGVERLQSAWPNLIVVHTPVHASWLNQVEIYFSVIQRKVLTPNDFSSLTEVKERLLGFQAHYEQVAKPFQWKFTRRDLEKLMERLEVQDFSKLKAA